VLPVDVDLENESAIGPLERAISDLFKRMQRSAPNISTLQEECKRLREALEQFREDNFAKNLFGFPEDQLDSLKDLAKAAEKKLTVAENLLSIDSPDLRRGLADFYTKDYKTPITLPSEEGKEDLHLEQEPDHVSSDEHKSNTMGFFSKLRVS